MVPPNDQEQEARFPIAFDVEGADGLDNASRALEAMKAKIKGSTDAIKEQSEKLRALKGNTDEIKKSRDELRAGIEKERGTLSSLKNALRQQSAAYKQAARDKKKLDEELRRKAEEQAKKQTDALSSALKRAGGPVSTLREHLDGLKEMFGAGNARAVLLTLGIAGLAAAVVALTAATVYGVAALGHWVVENANAVRAMAITREAMSGSAANADALGSQIDALARKVPLGTAALNDMASEITRSFSGSMLSGQGIVDTFQAVAGAAAAMGPQVGNQLQGILERGKNFGRVGIGRFELQGTGLNFDAVAKNVAKQMKTTVDGARAALLYGMVPIDKAAAAIRDAVNERFGEVNAKKMLDLGVIAQKFGDRLRNLTKGFSLEPVLRSLDKLSEMFDESTVTGAALQQMVTVFGRALGATFEAGTPILKNFFETLIIWAQRAILWGLRFALIVKNHQTVIGAAAAVLGGVMLGAVAALVPLVWSLAAGVVAATWPFLAIGAAIGLVGFAIYELVKHWDEVKTFFSGLATSAWDAGVNIVEGLVGGIESMGSRLVDSLRGLGKSAWAELTSFWQAHSPSQRAFGLGEDIGEGKARGIESKEDRVADAASGGGQAAAGAMARSGGGGVAAAGGGLTISIGTIVVQGARTPEEGRAAGHAAFEGFRAQALQFIEALGVQAGIPMQAEPT